MVKLNVIDVIGFKVTQCKRCDRKYVDNSVFIRDMCPYCDVIRLVEQGAKPKPIGWNKS